MTTANAPHRYARDLTTRLKRIAKERMLTHLNELEKRGSTRRDERLQVPLLKRPKETFPDIRGYTPFSTTHVPGYDYHHETVDYGDRTRQITVYHGGLNAMHVMNNMEIQEDFFQKCFEYAQEIEKELKEKEPNWLKIISLIQSLKDERQVPSYISGTTIPLNIKTADHALTQIISGDNLAGVFRSFYLVYLGLCNIANQKDASDYCGSVRYFLDVMVYFVKSLFETLFAAYLLSAAVTCALILVILVCEPALTPFFLLAPLLAPLLPWVAIAKYETGSWDIFKGPIEREIASLESYVTVKAKETRLVETPNKDEEKHATMEPTFCAG